MQTVRTGIWPRSARLGVEINIPFRPHDFGRCQQVATDAKPLSAILIYPQTNVETREVGCVERCDILRSQVVYVCNELERIHANAL